MIDRLIKEAISREAKKFPILAVVGPRQSGKTTLVKSIFKNHTYISLENPDIRKLVEKDPRSILQDFGEYLILDEIQRSPELFSYLQAKADENKKPGRYILTGSHQFLLIEKISQSLAGRVIIFQLLPFTLNELYRKNKPVDFYNIFNQNISPKEKLPEISKIILSGFYPPIHDRKLEPRKWIESYIQTYIERDIRSLINVSDLRTFDNFLRICAGHSGSITNFANIANATGVSEPTVKRWISMLETSGIIFILKPWSRNISKRLVKTPKLYFVDTAILCNLLSIRTKDDLITHPAFGFIFENFIISEIYKRFHHIGEIPPLFFYRDKTGNEIDLIIDYGKNLIPVEIKSSSTYSPDFIKIISKWIDFQEIKPKKGYLVYRGKDSFHKSETITAIPWKNL